MDTPKARSGYAVLLNEHGTEALKNTRIFKDFYEPLGQFSCHSVDQQGPLLLMNIHPFGNPLFDEEARMELQIPYEFVLCIVGSVDSRILGYVTRQGDDDKPNEEMSRSP